MGNVDAFLKSLLNFDKDNIPGVCGWTQFENTQVCLKSCDLN